jgi:hypothetical protein
MFKNVHSKMTDHVSALYFTKCRAEKWSFLDRLWNASGLQGVLLHSNREAGSSSLDR